MTLWGTRIYQRAGAKTFLKHFSKKIGSEKNK